MVILNAIFYSAAATALIALPFLLVNWIRYTTAQSANRCSGVQLSVRYPTKSVSFFVIPILVGVAIAEIITRSARNETLKFVQDLSGNSAVYVNQQRVRDADKIISALKQVTPYWAHHSDPTTRIKIDIRDEDRKLELELARDSNNPREYWVFSREYPVTTNNEIGRITTSILDDY